MEAVFVPAVALFFFYMIYRALRGETQVTKPEISHHSKSYGSPSRGLPNP